MQVQLSSIYKFSVSFAAFALSVLILAVLTVSPPVALAQNSIQLFGPVNVRLSSSGTGFGSSAVVFNSTTLNLTCPANPTAVVSSTPDGAGNLLVDNNINVTVIAGITSTGPTNICTGGVNGNPFGQFQNCFGNGYESVASSGNAIGVNPDTIAANDGIPPISINPLLVPGPIQLKIDLQDEGTGTGFYLTNSTLYLNTNCTQGGVTGPALVNGNPISSTDPTPSQLSQDFSFNPSASQQIGFEYDLTAASAAGGLTITDQTIPQVGDLPIDPATFQALYTQQTSFATSNCLVHSGELLPTGLPACKLFTLQCAVGTGSSVSGAQCPVSTQNNEIFRDVFDGPAFALADIPTPGGPTFHEGIGFLMASEDWNRNPPSNPPGGPCTYEAAANLGNLPCPQNLLTSFGSSTVSPNSLKKQHSTNPIAAANARPGAFAAITPLAASSSSGGTYTSSGRTTRPNSTFITVIQVPEDLTTVTVADQKAGYWNNTSTVNVTLSSQPPTLALTTLPGAQSFVASPIQSISYGLSPAATVPSPSDPTVTPTVLSSSVVCPTLASPTGVPASTFTSTPQTLSNLPDGKYLIYYYAQDCAGTEELHFVQDSNNNWSTSFYTYPVNIDTTAPVASTPILSSTATGFYSVGQSVTASFNCTDALSGITQCGPKTYAAGSTTSTGTLTAHVDTSTPGFRTFTITALDAAGNQTTSSVNYQVGSPYDNQIQLTVTPNTVMFPQAAVLTVQLVPSIPRFGGTGPGGIPITGNVKIYDGSSLFKTLSLSPSGVATDFLWLLPVGTHSFTAVYSGGKTIDAETSAPVLFIVKPVSTTLHANCNTQAIPYGSPIICSTFVTSNLPAAYPTGSVLYSYDNGVPLHTAPNGGVAVAKIDKPPVGQHTMVFSYPAQGFFAAAAPVTQTVTVLPAPVSVSLTPSTYALTGGLLKLSAAVQSPISSTYSPGGPRSTGIVTFTVGNTVLGTGNINQSGVATLSVAASALPNGSDLITASYSGGTNYATGAASVTVQVAHP